MQQAQQFPPELINNTGKATQPDAPPPPKCDLFCNTCRQANVTGKGPDKNMPETVQWQQRSSLRHLKSQNGFCWRGREDVKNILWKTPPASKLQMQPFLTFYQDPTTVLSGQGRALKGRQGDKRDHYATDCPRVGPTGLMSFNNHSEALLGFPCIRSYTCAIKSFPQSCSPIPVTQRYKLRVEDWADSWGLTAPRAGRSTKEATADGKPNRAELWLDIRGNFLTGRVVRDWNRQWWNHCPWKCSRDMWVWHLGTWAWGGLGSAGRMVNSNGFRGLFQAKQF